jgi:putative acetyltransferase
LSPDLNKWCQPLQNSYSLIYFEKENILGFGNITETGYLDRLYVHKDHIGKGIGNKLVEQLEAYAKDLGLKEIVTHASITARPFFEKRGYQLIKEQTVVRNNQHLTNYIMIKQLHKY